MVFAKDHDVIQAFPTDRADQSLRMAILPGRPRRDRVIPDAHRHKTPSDGMTVASVAVAEGRSARAMPLVRSEW